MVSSPASAILYPAAKPCDPLPLRDAGRPILASDRVGAVDLLGARFISRLLLPLLVPHDALIGAMRGLRLGPWHAFLAAVFAALILHTF